MSSSLTSLVPVLDGTNYQQWASAMKLFLLSQEQWKVISKPAPVYKATTTTASTLTSGGKKKQTKEDEGEAEELTVTTDNQEAIDNFEDLNDKAVGNICLQLHHTIGYQFNNCQHVILWSIFIFIFTSKCSLSSPFPHLQLNNLRFKNKQDNNSHCKMNTRPATVMSITVKVKVLPIIYPMSSINDFIYHFINLSWKKILMHLFPLHLPVNKDVHHLQSSPIHKTKNIDDSSLNVHKLLKILSEILCWKQLEHCLNHVRATLTLSS